MRKLSLLTIALGPLLLLQGCALDALGPQPDDPNYAPAIPEEEYTYAIPNGSIYNPYTSNNGLYTDTKAHRIGDIISVILEESTSARKSAATDLEKTNTVNNSGVTLFGKKLSYKDYDLSYSNTNSNNFEGDASASQSNSLTGSISVSVTRVLSNGILEVRGEKWLMLNNGNEYVRVTGLIRPDDISSNNEVSSQRIANARIQYGGTGDFADTQERGWVSRFFNSVFNVFF